ncbi:Acetyl esterase/lipase [Tangfeifania diversioriginum]|uniref:Acetyl esterase/lipase n=1 Tax=Tangfeifania diversioriginum TaxID=1168035 RepID=A0A1M6EBJ5_9BACT|nr:alpha/beta hydrolase [Tangfeifania diversioriginum]SHI82678.1 Acetyl esterase/lipase [Tangfeifania diversioriginum]
MKQLISFFIFVFMSFSLYAQDKVIKVWPNGAPNDNGMTEPEEKYEGVRVRNVSEAEMYVYLPDEKNNTGAAVVICPGGGYWIEAMDHEGYDIAEWLKSKGVAGIVLKYRLPYGNHEVPSSDARQAIKIVRRNATDWGIHPDKIGIAGSSAGGHLASTVGTHFDYGNLSAQTEVEKMSSRPDFMLLLYPVITFREEFGHMGSRKNLIGEGNNWKMVEKYSNELHVSSETPPTFLVLADDDSGVPPRNSVEFYLALKENSVPAEMHIFAEGGHGFGITKHNQPADQWPDLFYNWLKAIEIID